jgi:hypothetical protein
MSVFGHFEQDCYATPSGMAREHHALNWIVIRKINVLPEIRRDGRYQSVAKLHRSTTRCGSVPPLSPATRALASDRAIVHGFEMASSLARKGL